MSILACGCTCRRCRCASPTPPAIPRVIDPPEPPEQETEPLGTLPVHPDGESLGILFTLPAGVRVRVEANSADPAAVRWLHDVGVAAMVLAMRCEPSAATGASAR